MSGPSFALPSPPNTSTPPPRVTPAAQPAAAGTSHAECRCRAVGVSPTGACTAAHDSDFPSVSRIYSRNMFSRRTTNACMCLLAWECSHTGISIFCTATGERYKPPKISHQVCMYVVLPRTRADKHLSLDRSFAFQLLILRNK